jgi:uncharacterized protein (UPF0210 family)
MSLIIWKEEFSVGVAEVDFEHRELIELINGLHDSARPGTGRNAVIESLGEIFAQTNFATSWMRSKTTANMMKLNFPSTLSAGSAITSERMTRNCIKSIISCNNLDLIVII